MVDFWVQPVGVNSSVVHLPWISWGKHVEPCRFVEEHGKPSDKGSGVLAKVVAHPAFIHESHSCKVTVSEDCKNVDCVEKSFVACLSVTRIGNRSKKTRWLVNCNEWVGETISQLGSANCPPSINTVTISNECNWRNRNVQDTVKCMRSESVVPIHHDICEVHRLWETVIVASPLNKRGVNAVKDSLSESPVTEPIWAWCCWIEIIHWLSNPHLVFTLLELNGFCDHTTEHKCSNGKLCGLSHLLVRLKVIDQFTNRLVYIYN